MRKDRDTSSHRIQKDYPTTSNKRPPHTRDGVFHLLLHKQNILLFYPHLLFETMALCVALAVLELPRDQTDLELTEVCLSLPP